jgi:hypothetical protein
VELDGENTVVIVTHAGFPLEATYKHSEFHWTVTMNVLKKFVENAEIGHATETKAI